MSENQNTINGIPAQSLRSFGNNSVLIGSVTGGTVNFNLPAPSFEAAINQLKPISSNTSPNPMHYLSGGIGFYGREEEILWMDRFCQMNATVQYAILYGIGGVGKSKFMYEYIKSHIYSNWHMCFITEDIVTSLLFFPDYNYPNNLLIVVDYASRNSEIVGKWIAKLSTTDTASNKIRIVLIERQGQSGEIFMPWFEKLYGNSSQQRLLKQVEYGFLHLKQMDSLHLRNLIIDYVAANYPSEQIDANDVGGIIEYASHGLEIDENRQSPLIVLLVTDAFVSGKDYRKWNLALLVQNYIEKLKENWLTALCNNDAELLKSLVRILVFATVINGLDINKEIPQYFSSSLSCLTESPLCKGILENATGLIEDVVQAVEPDIIGEFFVLDYLNSLVLFKAKRECVVSFYVRPVMLLDFINRCIEDYAETKAFSNFFDNYIELLKPPINAEPFNEFYAMFLGRYFYHCDLERKNDCLKILRKLHIDEVENNSRYIIGATTIYTWLLADFTSIKGMSDYIEPDYFSKAFKVAKDAIDELEELTKKYSSKNPKVLSAYSRALANFSNYSSKSESHDCVHMLRSIYDENFRDNSDVVISYAMALNNYIMVLGKTPSDSSLRVAKTISSQLADLYESHVKKAINISVDLNNAVFVNAFSDPELRDNFDSIKDAFLTRADMYQGQVAIEYAKGLNNLIGLCAQLNKYEDAFESFATLKELYSRHGTEMSDIKIDYAKAMANIIHGCETEEANDMLRELKGFYLFEKRQREVYAVRYMNALTNRFSRILKDGIYIDDVDTIFSEACAVYFEYENCSLDITMRYAICVYYMFNILVRTQHYDENGDELELLYKTLYNMYNDSDPRLKETIGQYVDHINRMFQ